MTKKWKLMEIIIGISLIIFAAILFYSIYSYLSFWLEICNNQNKTESYKISLLKVFKNWHSGFIVIILSFTAGLFLIFGKKFAWSMSIIVCAYEFLVLFVVLFNRNEDLIFFVFPILFLISLVVLLLRPFRERYLPTKKDLLIIAISIFFLLIDKFFIS